MTQTNVNKSVVLRNINCQYHIPPTPRLGWVSDFCFVLHSTYSTYAKPPPGAMFYSSYNCATNVVMRVVTQQHLSLKLALNVVSAVHEIGEPHTHSSDERWVQQWGKWQKSGSLMSKSCLSPEASLSLETHQLPDWLAELRPCNIRQRETPPLLLSAFVT